MIEMESIEAYSAAASKPHYSFPQASDSRNTRFSTQRAGYLLPTLTPRFKLKPTDKVFTVGSCFTDVFDTHLKSLGCTIPIANFSIPTSEYVGTGRGVLVEYVPGTLEPRIAAAYNQQLLHPMAGVQEEDGLFVDMFLHADAKPVTLDRLLQRRGEIVELYREIHSSDVVLITLTYIESWYDKQYGCYLNRPPSFFEIRKNPNRYAFRRLEYQDCVDSLSRTIKVMVQNGVKKIMLMMAPMPFGTSFFPEDIVMASTYSKSVLRCAIEKLWTTFPEVEYFPSYEVGNSFGIAGYDDDHVHLNQMCLEVMTSYFTQTYFD